MSQFQVTPGELSQAAGTMSMAGGNIRDAAGTVDHILSGAASATGGPGAEGALQAASAKLRDNLLNLSDHIASMARTLHGSASAYQASDQSVGNGLRGPQ